MFHQWKSWLGGPLEGFWYGVGAVDVQLVAAIEKALGVLRRALG